MGFCNFYRRFIKEYGRVARPLNKLTQKETPFVFDQACQEAFQELKNCLTLSPILGHYNPESESMLETDASDEVVAGILSQKGKDQLWHPIAYFSKTMTPAECNYEIHDKELLAIIKALGQLRAELEGIHSTIKIYTDHQALEYFMTKRQLTARQIRWSDILSQFNFEIVYQPGRKNIKADALTQRKEDQDSQRKVILESRNQVLLKPHQLDSQIRTELEQSLLTAVNRDLEAQLAPLEGAQDTGLIDQVL